MKWLWLIALVAGCGGRQVPTTEDISVCLFRMNAALGAATTCEAIVKAITSVVVEDPKCSELLLHGLKCIDNKDGG